MGKINWKRVFVIGLMLGAIEFNLNILNALLFAGDALSALEEVPWYRGFHPLLSLPMYCLVGIVTVWLYAAIRPRYGPGPGTAAIAGFVVWLVSYVAHVQWASNLTVISTGALVVTTLVSVPIFVGATVLCVSAYKESTGLRASEGAATEPVKG